MSLVLDTSATLAWVYVDETSSPIRKVFDQVAESGAWVPALWRLEIANVLEMGVRRSRHDAGFRDATLSDLSLLPIYLDPDTDKQAWGATVHLAHVGVPLYDHKGVTQGWMNYYWKPWKQYLKARKRKP